MIVFSSVSKQFLPDTYALKDISFEINPGELVLLTGPSGAGKTTLMKLITKEYDPTSGEILFHGTNLKEIKNSKIHEHRRKIGVVFQEDNLIPELNIWENIALPLSIIGKDESEIEERVTDLLELVSLTDKALHFPKQLSGGEAQRIGIARALSTAPSIIFADEPTGNLDRDNSLQIAKLLTKINELGTTVLFSTHDHDVIGLLNAHRHIVLTSGSIVSDTADKTKKPKPDDKVNGEARESTLGQKKKETEEKKTETKPVAKTEAKVEPTPELKNEKKQGFFSSLFNKPKPSEKISLSDPKEEGKQLDLELEPKEKEVEKASDDTVDAKLEKTEDKKEDTNKKKQNKPKKKS